MMGMNLCGGLSSIITIIFFFTILISAILLIKWLFNLHGQERPSRSALEILSERYAKGEIDEQEYKQKKQNLT